jgi:carbon storage regulator
MLVIRRRIGERIVIAEGIEITVASLSPGAVKLTISAPRGVSVLRGEVHDAVVAANLAACSAELTEFVSQPLEAHDDSNREHPLRVLDAR